MLSELISEANFFSVFVFFACLIESEDVRQEKRHIKQLSCKGAKRNNHLLRINHSTNRTKIVKHNKAKCDNVISILQFCTSVTFTGVRGSSFTGDIAVDDFTLRAAGSCVCGTQKLLFYISL